MILLKEIVTVERFVSDFMFLGIFKYMYVYMCIYIFIYVFVFQNTKVGFPLRPFLPSQILFSLTQFASKC